MDTRHGGGRNDRRQFLRGTLCAAAALGPVGKAWGALVEQRSLSFVHTHTGERLSTVYFQDGAYVAQELDRVNHLLRDFRTGDLHPIDPALLDILFDLRTLIEHDQPFEVISGYRSPKTNEALRRCSSGVSPHSLHMEGRAIDVRLAGFSTVTLHDVARGMRRGGVGYYAASDFVHLDNGRVRYW